MDAPGRLGWPHPTLLTIGLCLCTGSPAYSDPFGDAVASYAPAIVGGEPLPVFRAPSNALGPPDFDPAPCQVAGTCTFVSLGQGGQLTVELTTNFLTGSGDASPDLVIYEVGLVLEATRVEVSADGINFISVGTASGGTSSIDVDAFGIGPGQPLFFVRLIDDPSTGDSFGPDVGADIDAIEVLSSIPPVPTLGPSGALALVLALFTVTAWSCLRRGPPPTAPAVVRTWTRRR